MLPHSKKQQRVDLERMLMVVALQLLDLLHKLEDLQLEQESFSQVTRLLILMLVLVLLNHVIVRPTVCTPQTSLAMV
jgi:hypothetical protein